MSEWDAVTDALDSPDGQVEIAMVGKYINLTDSYKSLTEALIHAGIHTRHRVKITYVDAEDIEKYGTGCLEGVDAILVPGGFGPRGIEGKIQAARHARENKVPYLGICLGMQVAVIEFARHKAGLKDADSTEFNKNTPHPVIALITEWTEEDGSIERRDEDSNLGGTMRLGAQGARLREGSLVREMYGVGQISERHRHRFEFNNAYEMTLTDSGLAISGKTLDGSLVCLLYTSDAADE